MNIARTINSTTVAVAITIGIATAVPVNAEVTVLGWPGGPEETALRAATEAYNALPEIDDADKVELIFFSRDGFSTNYRQTLLPEPTLSTQTYWRRIPSVDTRRS